METKFRSFSYEIKAPLRISLPPRMSLRYQHSQGSSSEQTGLMPTPGALERKESYGSRLHSLPGIPLFLYLVISQIFREPLFCARRWARTWEHHWVKQIWRSLFSLYLCSMSLSEDASLAHHLSPQSSTHPSHTLSPYLLHLPPFPHTLLFFLFFSPHPHYNVSSIKARTFSGLFTFIPPAPRMVLAHRTRSTNICWLKKTEGEILRVRLAGRGNYGWLWLTKS